jgi:hypothetical protein
MMRLIGPNSNERRNKRFTGYTRIRLKSNVFSRRKESNNEGDAAPRTAISWPGASMAPERLGIPLVLLFPMQSFSSSSSPRSRDILESLAYLPIQGENSVIGRERLHSVVVEMEGLEND